MFGQQKQTFYLIVLDIEIIVAQVIIKSLWRINLEAFSHCRAVSILLAASEIVVYIACLRWCTTQFVWTACCLCPSPLSRVCLAWLLTSAVVCGRRPRRRELTGRCCARFVDKWGVGFQCEKDDGEGQKWLITVELRGVAAPDEGSQAELVWGKNLLNMTVSLWTKPGW